LIARVGRLEILNALAGELVGFLAAPARASRPGLCRRRPGNQFEPADQPGSVNGTSE